MVMKHPTVDSLITNSNKCSAESSDLHAPAPMKQYAFIAALALALPSAAEAGKSHHRGHHGGHNHGGHRHHGGHYHGGHYARSYPSYGYRSYGYRSYGYPAYYSPYRYGGYGYGGYGYGYGSGYGYYGGLPSVSFVYSSTPRNYANSYYDSTATSLEVNVQRALKRRGYYSGSIDGDIGPGSRSAIRSFQSDRGLAVTGRIDSALLRSLGI